MKKLTAAALFCLFCLFAKADTFVVTSNADSGPGTLRDAIEQANANGTTSEDFIRFNLPQISFNQRIIDLMAELPDLTSNITIDGTSQPGRAYAMTDAKICIRKNDYASSFSILRIANAQQVKIYGLYLYHGYWQGFFSLPFRSSELYGISLANANDIEIGAPGKGNVINGSVHGIYAYSDSCRNIRIKSNYIGHGGYYQNQQDDFDVPVLGAEACITLANVRDITIGGDNADEGNIFGSPRRAINIDSKYTTGNGFIKIRYNLLGRKWDKRSPVDVYDFWDAYVNIGRSRNNPLDWSSEHEIDYRVEFTDNDIPSHVVFGYISDSIIVQRNRFDEDYRGTNAPERKLFIVQSPKGGVIGGDDAANANFFYKKRGEVYYPSIFVYESGPVTILKNVFDCNSMLGSTTWVNHYNKTVPFAQVDLTTADSVMGRATPDTRVDLYYDDECTACEGKSYITRVTANAAGQWKYVAPIRGTVVATATSAAGSTSPFSTPMFNTDSVELQQPTCGKNNGSIKGIKTEGAESYFWVRYRYPQKDTVSRSLDLTDAGYGHYVLFAVHGGTCIQSINHAYQLNDHTPTIVKNRLSISQPSCGLFNGSISGLEVYNSIYTLSKWIDSQGQTISTETSVDGLGPGTYRFVVTDTTQTGGCSDTATFVLTNQAGPSVHTGNIRITNASCGRSNGSIRNISVTNTDGSVFFQWVDSLKNPVGNAADLIDVPPGKYRLFFKDGAACDTVVTPFYTVGNNGEVMIDTTAKIITPAKCSGNTGSIQNIKITGGENYEWKNTATGATVGTAPDVFNLPAGNYQLTVTSSFGCSQLTQPFSISKTSFIPLQVNGWHGTHANCQLPNGQIVLSLSRSDTNEYTFRWVDSASSLTVSNYANLYNVYGGTYLQFAKDSNGCEEQVVKMTIENKPLPVFDYTHLKVTSDKCLSGEGAIQGMVIKNLWGTSVSYIWINDNQDTVGYTANLGNLSPGTYRLQATNMGCTVTSQPIVVSNVNVPLSDPVYDEQLILKGTAATLNVKNPLAGTYQLFDSPSATTPLQQNTTGIFTTPVLSADQVFYVRYVRGVCTSNLVPVTVKVIDKTAVYVPTAFTPNGDGKNDVLKAIPFGRIKLIHFIIYNRWGQVVFSTETFNKGWNGTVYGQTAETGVYVWLVKAVDELSGKRIEEKGTVTIIR